MHIVFKSDLGEEQAITVDATLSEQHETSVLVTERSVESGAPVSDHIRPEPVRLRIEAHITNTPVRPEKTFMDGAEMETQGIDLQAVVMNPPLVRVGPIPIGGGLATVSFSAVVLTSAQNFDRVRAVYEALLALQRTGTIIRIVTSLREYDDMVIRNMSVPRTAEDGSAITVTFDAQQIRFATTETVSAPDPLEARGRPQINRGRQEPTPQVAEPPNQSFLVGALTGVGVLSP